MIIGICGGSGSGKTTLLKRLAAHFEHMKPTVFSMDNYYRPIEEQCLDANGQVNFDLPTALDEQQLISDLARLKSGEAIEVKEYHFNAPPGKNVLITLEPSPVIIVEGLFLFHYREVREMLDFTVFMDVDPQTQLDRRLYRDQETRGYSREAILYQWEHHVIPCFEQFLMPYEDIADFHFKNDNHADQEFDRLLESLSHKLEWSNV
ncbi:MAG: AAA family ATPase [Bacteroidota bacterium]